MTLRELVAVLEVKHPEWLDYPMAVITNEDTGLEYIGDGTGVVDEDEDPETEAKVLVFTTEI